MEEMPGPWSAVCALVFILGARHGLDADHLATIDGLTRFNQRRGRSFARYCGALFSLGHGIVVIAVAVTIARMRRNFSVPAWVELAGTWIAIASLLVLAALNLRAYLRARPNEIVSPVGIRSRLLRRFTRVGGPVAIALIGAGFAVSFDTISQSALFALTAARFGGTLEALCLGVLFAMGMLIMDAVNGIWIARLMARADRAAVIASRLMSLIVAAVSLAVAGLGIVGWVLPSVGRWIGQRDLAMGGAVCGIIALGYVGARRLARQETRQTARA